MHVSATRTRSPRREALDGQRAPHLLGEIALKAGHQDRERRHRHAGRHVGGHLQKRLRVGHHEGRRLVERVERPPQLAVLRHQRQALAVEQIADRHHLRQDEAPFRRLLVDGHHEHGHLARRHEIRDNAPAVEMIRGSKPEQRLTQVPHALAGQGGERHEGSAALLQARALVLGERPLVDLVHRDDDGNLAPREFGHQAVFEAAPRAGLGHHDAEVDAVEDGPCALHPQLAERAFVVHAGSVDEQHRAERQQLHGLLDGVRRGAGDGRDDGHVLARDRVQQRGLPHVAAAEQADVEPQGFRRRLHQRAPPPARGAGVLNPSRDTASADVQASNCSAVTKPCPTAVAFSPPPSALANATNSEARA